MLGDLFMLIWPPAKLWPYVCKFISFILNILMAGRTRAYQTVGNKRLLQLEKGDRVVWLNDKEEALHGKVEDILELSAQAYVVFDKPSPKSVKDVYRMIVGRSAFVPIAELIEEEHFGKSGEEEQEKIEQERPKLQDVHVSQADPSKVNRLFRAGEEVELGSVVWVDDVGKGIVKWIGTLNQHDDILIAGLEMFEPHASCTDGSFLGKKIINNCEPDHGLFVPLAKCRLIGKTLFEQAAKQNHLVTPVGALTYHSGDPEHCSLPGVNRPDQQRLLDQAKRERERKTAKPGPGQSGNTENHHSFDGNVGGGYDPSDINVRLKATHDAGQLNRLFEEQKWKEENAKGRADMEKREKYNWRNGSSKERLFPDTIDSVAGINKWSLQTGGCHTEVADHTGSTTLVKVYSKHVGQMRGIETDGKSSYMEATLYSLLTFSRVLSEALEIPKMGESPTAADVRRSLGTIRMSLQNGYCVSQHQMRELITSLRAVSPFGELGEPGEFLEFLLEKVLQLEPFIKLSNDQESFHYQLFVESKTSDVLPDIQDLISRSLDEAKVRLLKASPCFIIQMPRFGDYKPFEYVLPTPVLDLEPMRASPVASQSLDSDVSAGECYCCGGEAELECIECGPWENEYGHAVGGTPYCRKCVGLSHNKVKRQDHNPRRIRRQVMASSASGNDNRGNLKPMELFAIIAVAQYDSQYVAFVKHGSGGVAKWYFHGNTRDRGKNVPEVQDCTKDMNDWIIDKDGQRELLKRVLDAQTCTPGSSLDTSWMQVPPLVRRILTDGYMYIYQLPGMEMKD